MLDQHTDLGPLCIDVNLSVLLACNNEECRMRYHVDINMGIG